MLLLHYLFGITDSVRVISGIPLEVCIKREKEGLRFSKKKRILNKKKDKKRRTVLTRKMPIDAQTRIKNR
jgi:hypothetical protein